MAEAIPYPAELIQRASKVKLLLMDCDGVLTDGRIYLLPDPAGGLFETKAFHSTDGIALHWAHAAGIEMGIISGRTSRAVEERARTGHMKYLYQGDTGKIPAFEEVLADSQLPPEQVGYIGDDLTDLPIMRRVGLAAAPSDSRPEVLEAAHFVTPAPGGGGAVRDVIELILKGQGRWSDVVAKYEI